MILLCSSCSCSNNKQNDKNENNANNTITEKQEKYYKVIFKTDQGHVVEEIDVEEGKNIIPPQHPNIAGYIFNGWKGNLYNIKDDSTIIGVYENIKEQKNVVYVENIYARANEQIKTSVNISGMVCFCGIIIEVTYNNNLLEFVEFANIDDNVIVNHDLDNGKIYLNYISLKNTKGDVTFVDIVFNAKEKSSFETKIDVHIEEIVYFNDIDELINTEYNIKENKMIIIGE